LHLVQKHHFFTPFPATELYEQVFGPTRDDGRTQTEWATSTTCGANTIWAGRPGFRARVLTDLLDLQTIHPDVLQRALPTP
jgi:hypothetical protein